jgi:hypothetical protein
VLFEPIALIFARHRSVTREQFNRMDERSCWLALWRTLSEPVSMASVGHDPMCADDQGEDDMRTRGMMAVLGGMLVATLVVGAVAASQDIDGAGDHPDVPRVAGAYIVYQDHVDFDRVAVPWDRIRLTASKVSR